MKNSCSFIIFHSMVKGAWKFDNGTARQCVILALLNV